ncbi:ATP-binding protein [Proteinivorax hydrogeniformans]|uniref:histidine kinase n=1 Tax=Proteinivorax hydrogeniformans TaxID=1826727 RepID=A0AAU8HWD8_9FIRM
MELIDNQIKVSFKVNSVKNLSKEKKQDLICYHSKLIAVSKILFDNLDSIVQKQVACLVFNQSGHLLSKHRCSSFPIADSTLAIGEDWSKPSSTSPIKKLIKDRQCFVFEELEFKEQKVFNWTFVAVPIIGKTSKVFYGAILIAVPKELNFPNLEQILCLASDIMSETLANSHDVKEVQERFSQMFASFAHEIKNILTSIRGFTQLLQTKIVDKNNTVYVNFILEELDRAHSILKNSIYFSKAQKDKANECKLSDILQDVLSALTSVIERNNISIAVNIDKTIPHITGDAVQFRQVFLNIIQNSIEAMEDGGTLKVTCKLKNLQIIVNVSDTGPGIPEKIAEQIFAPFYSTKHGGTGLGLSVSKQVVEQYKGQIYCKSSDKGTTFTIILPART